MYSTSIEAALDCRAGEARIIGTITVEKITCLQAVSVQRQMIRRLYQTLRLRQLLTSILRLNDKWPRELQKLVLARFSYASFCR